MSAAPPTQAVANLHLHLEYDSSLDVIAAAMARVPDDSQDAHEHRAHVSQDISVALARLLDVDALASAGAPLRITEVAVEVTVGSDEHTHDDGLGSASLELAELHHEEGVESERLTAAEIALIAEGVTVSGSAGAPPLHLGPADIHRFVADWRIVCGYLARACSSVMDSLFDDFLSVSEHPDSPGLGTDLGSFLPAQWERLYGPQFFRRFIVTMADVTGRVAAGWEGPVNLAQVLAVSYLVDAVTPLAGLDGRALDSAMVAALRERLVDEEIVEDILGGIAPEYGFEMWFVPFSDEPAAPYATD